LRPDNLPARDWSERRQDWQDHRDDIREDWQDHRDYARDDWQGWFHDHYGANYGDWYSGYAPAYWNRWDPLWDNYAVAAAAGLTWWGANNLGYQYGYLDYYNPYYTESMPVYYSEPIITAPVETVIVQQSAPPGTAPAPAATLPPPAPQPPEDMSNFDASRTAFYDGKYDEALKLIDAAMAQKPRDAVLHEFRSLVLFALQRYGESAAAIHAVLDVGPGWDWKTLSSLYPSMTVYTNQLRALESATERNPNAADLRFLLGYHYLTCYQPDSALKMFRRVVELQPRDAVAASLVATLSPRDAQVAEPSGGTAPSPVPPDRVVGNWTATGAGSSNYSMALNKDGTFTWGFRKGSRKDESKGVYTIEGNVLAMEPDAGGVLLAELTAKGSDSLQFKMVGGPKNDPGLEFRRGQ
jgi:tetratricopeptide (TPR) repeat protein